MADSGDNRMLRSAVLKYVDYAESWYKTWCPYCDVANWHCNGNEQDLSSLDVEAIECRKCGKVYRLGVFDEIDEEIRGNGFIVQEVGLGETSIH